MKTILIAATLLLSQNLFALSDGQMSECIESNISNVQTLILAIQPLIEDKSVDAEKLSDDISNPAVNSCGYVALVLINTYADGLKKQKDKAAGK